MKSKLLLPILLIVSLGASYSQEDESLNNPSCFSDVERLEQLNTIPAALDSIWMNAYTTTEFLQAGDARFKHADSVLNVIYSEIMSSLDCLKESQHWDHGLVDKIEQSLKEAQRAWIIQRDKEAEFVQLSARGGTIGTQWYLGEVFSATMKRNAELIEFLEHLEWVDTF